MCLLSVMVRVLVTWVVTRLTLVCWLYVSMLFVLRTGRLMTLEWLLLNLIIILFWVPAWTLTCGLPVKARLVIVAFTRTGRMIRVVVTWMPRLKIVALA